jgi:hypothetical protein
LLKLCCHSWLVQHGIVLFLGFGWRDISYGLHKPSMVEPVHPFECCELNGFEVSPRPSSMNDLSLVKTVYRFCESVVVTISDAADGWTCFAKVERFS